MDMAKVAVALEDPSLVAASTASPALVMYKKKDSAVAGRKSGKKHLVGTGSSSSSSSFPPLPSHPSGVANGFKLHGPLEARSPSPRDFYLAPLRPDDYLEEAFRAFRSSEAGEQEDAQEFLAFLLDRLHEEAVGAGAGGEEGKGAREEEEGEGGWQEVGEKGRVAKLSVSGVKQTEKGTPDVSAISRLFYGRERSDIRRATSRSISATMTRFNCLQLDLPPLGGGGKKEVALEEVIEHSFREEVIESSDGTFLRKKLCLDALPPVLILHLKRFIFDLHQGVGVKLHHRVHYPSCLRLPSQMLSVSLRTTAGIEGGKGERKGLAYELFAVGLHYGRSLNGGHYTVFCKEGGCGKEWVGYDDERVDRVQEWEVKSYTEQVYLLFYERV
jgi:ubiquitin carboxyl-terminal hydrolase 10